MSRQNRLPAPPRRNRRAYAPIVARAAALALVAVVTAHGLLAQNFVRVENPVDNPITGLSVSSYSGAAWIDYDGDGDLDLFINNDLLFRNEGGDAFAKVETEIGAVQPTALGNGQTWADYDNDGDLDVYVCSVTSFLYRNEGGGAFTRITDGEMGAGTANRGWSCAWADYDNDGFVDLAVTYPDGFVDGSRSTNHLFRNDGPPAFTFSRILTGPIVSGFATYTVGTWSDFDQDGDVDYFIGAGPVSGTTAPDYLYRNLLTESGEATFERITEGIIATEPQDGQVWTWVDYDNDGDLDAFLTNWGLFVDGGMPNRLYRNDDGVFTKVTSGPVVEDNDVSISPVWGDFDNDGDLDLFVTNDSGRPDRYYRNDGDGTFTSVENEATRTQTSRGASAGDYDDDGDLDLVVVAPDEGTALFRNDLAEGNHWLKLRLTGTTSNRAAIGAKVRVLATVGGASVWQMREVSAQNTFNGQNSLEVHFGLGDAATVEAVRVEWPSGGVSVLNDVPADQTLTITEVLVNVANETETGELPADVALWQNYPNPFNPVTTIRFDLTRAGPVRLTVYDLAGRAVRTLADGFRPAGTYEVRFDATGLPSGIYLYRLEGEGFAQTRRLTLLK
ncbi:FG-GAP-like repeat-containing protein [Rhodocaloribacter sp.]